MPENTQDPLPAAVPELPAQEEALLAAIADGRFTLVAAQGRYAGLRRIPRRQEPPPTPEEIRAARLRDAQAIRRIGTSQIQSTEKLEIVLLSLTENLSSLRDELHKQGHPHWWHLADAVDDVMDIYELHFGLVPPKEEENGSR